MSILSGIGASRPPVQPVQQPPAPGNAQSNGELKVGTYNLAAGNKDHKDNAPETTAHLADKVVNDGLDVVALQEVDVDTDRLEGDLPDGITDYNEYVLAQVSAEEAGLKEPITYERTESADGTVTITGSDEDHRSSKVTIAPEYYTAEGEPTEAGSSDAAIKVYNAEMQSPEGVRDYTIVYGASWDVGGGTYGNAVLLGPNAPLQRMDDGSIDVKLHDLGADDPKNENRTALEVTIEAGGETATVFSAHLSAGKDGADARQTQYDTLARLAEASGDNTILLGDFNSSGEGTIGPLSGENDDENDPGFWSMGNPIDRIYVSDDVDASGREHVEGGGSDHSLITWDIDLNA